MALTLGNCGVVVVFLAIIVWGLVWYEDLCIVEVGVTARRFSGHRPAQLFIKGVQSDKSRIQWLFQLSFIQNQSPSVNTCRGCLYRSVQSSPVFITFISFSAISGWIDFIRRVVFFNSCHVSLGRSSVFSSLQNVWNNKTAELPLILLSLFSLIISETDVKLYWYTSTVTGYEELAVSFGSSLSSTPQNSSERHEVWILLHRWYWQKIENVIVRALTVTKLCKKSRSFVQNFLGSAETQPFSAALCPKARPHPFFLKILLRG